MNAWLKRARELWHKIFFWHPRPGESGEFKPEAHHDHALVIAVTGPQPIPRWKQLRFLNRVLSPGERRLFWISFVAFWILLAVGLVEFARPHLVPVPAVGGTIAEGLVGTPKLINPLFPTNDVDRDLSSMIFSGLFRLNRDFQPEPDLVDNYRWLPDGQTLEVTLRQDARFHDGQPLTADDVVFTYAAAKNPNWRSPLLNVYRGLTVIRIDDQTVQIQTDKPRPNLLNDLTLGILPAHVWSDVADVNANLAEANIKPIGSGPYQVESFTRDSKGALLTYRLKRFPAYYGLKPNIDEWQFQFYPDRPQAEEALRNNQIDSLAFLPWTSVPTLARSNFKPATLELPQETVAFFNVTDPMLKDIKLRQALSLAVDHTELAGLIDPHFHVVNSPFPFLDATSTPVDLDQARKLLDADGWKLPDGATVRQFTPAPTPPPPAPKPTRRGQTAAAPTPPPAPVAVSSTPFVLTIDVPNQPDLIKIAELLQRRWSLLGAEVHVNAEEAEGLYRQVTDQRQSYQILLWNVLLTPDQDLSPFWSSANSTGHGLNFSNLADRDVDQALDAVQSASSTASIRTARQTLSDAILSKYAALFLFRPAYAYMVSTRVHGVTDMRIARPSDRLLYTMDWYINTGWSWR